MGVIVAALVVVLSVGIFMVTTEREVGTNPGIQDGYMPEQPIQFQHNVHAGIEGIDCEYCHSKVESSGPHPNVSSDSPSVEVCESCHAATDSTNQPGTSSASPTPPQVLFSLGNLPTNFE